MFTPRSLFFLLLFQIPLAVAFACPGDLSFPVASTPQMGEENPKFERAKRIFAKLVEAKGDRSRIVPVLNWTDERGNGAYFLPGTNQIFMEEAAFDVCATFGEQTDDAIAYILSHELIHYYKDHGWEASFATRFSGTQVATDVDETTHDIKQQETESDLLGGFLAYTAGYNTVGMATEFLPRLYDAYPRWPREKSQKYPSLQERIDIAATTMKDLQYLIRVFETANYLVAVERFGAAMDMYNFVLSKYASRELLNNMGVVACMAAIQILGKEVVQYAYPLELDAEARLKLSTKGLSGFGDEMAACDSLLRIGIKHFQEALFLDESYDPAVLNLGCAYAIRGLANYGKDETIQKLHYDYAAIYARDAKERSVRAQKSKLEGDAITLMGIIAAETGGANAEALFAEAQSKSGLAAVNLAIFKKEPFQSSGRRLGMGMMSEEIEGFDIAGFKNRMVADTTVLVNSQTSRKWGVKEKALEHSYILLDFVNARDRAWFQITKPSYTGADAQTVEGISLGMSKEEVLQKYLTPDREVQLPNGAFMVYPANNIIFRIADDKVIEWAVYRKLPAE